MDWELALLAGAALNGYGAFQFFIRAIQNSQYAHEPADYRQLQLFVAGTAMTFAVLYLYLFWHSYYAWPFLLFGAALKSWAFSISLFLYLKKGLKWQIFAEFGLSNGFVALLFGSIFLPELIHHGLQQRQSAVRLPYAGTSNWLPFQVRNLVISGDEGLRAIGQANPGMISTS